MFIIDYAMLRPLKNSISEINENLDNIYTKSKHLERPNTLQSDNQFSNKQFRDYCNGHVKKQIK